MQVDRDASAFVFLTLENLPGKISSLPLAFQPPAQNENHRQTSHQHREQSSGEQ